jgi:hypothetical protein
LRKGRGLVVVSLSGLTDRGVPPASGLSIVGEVMKGVKSVGRACSVSGEAVKNSGLATKPPPLAFRYK